MLKGKKSIHIILSLVFCLSLLSFVLVRQVKDHKKEDSAFKVAYETSDLPHQLEELLFTTEYLEFINLAGYNYDALNSTMSNRVTDLSHPNTPYFRLTTYPDGSYLIYMTQNEVEVSFFLDQDLQASNLSAETSQGKSRILTEKEREYFLSKANLQLQTIVDSIYQTMYSKKIDK